MHQPPKTAKSHAYHPNGVVKMEVIKCCCKQAFNHMDGVCEIAAIYTKIYVHVGVEIDLHAARKKLIVCKSRVLTNWMVDIRTLTA